MGRLMIIIIALMICGAVVSDVSAQVEPPPVTGDKELRDSDIKKRSADLERVTRDARKADARETGQRPAERDLAEVYDEIKADFETIQVSQDSVVTTYQTGAEIDYKKIGKLAGQIRKSAARLEANLFPGISEKDEKDERSKDAETELSVRDLIIQLDNSIGKFITSKMFANLREVDSKVAESTHGDLRKIIRLSGLLEKQSLKKTGSKE